MYINSPARIAYLAFVRRLNNFSAQTDIVESKILENWSQNCDIKCYLCWSGENKRTVFVYVGHNLFFINLIIFSLDAYIFYSGAGSEVVF